MDWTAGYITDIDYTHGYYRELSPSIIDFVLLLRSFASPRRGENMHYLELGYGQGLSANIHAAAVPGTYIGTDFNPAHAANAQELARISEAPVQFFDDSFSELLENHNLPDFDYITLHGIWSWVTDETRSAIVDIIRRRLKVGGVVYMSYNTLPGWASAMPLRHMLALHSETAGSDAQGYVSRIDAALAFTKKLAEANARYFLANPSTKERLDKIGEQNRNYVAHEYFNREWEPMYFSQMNNLLSQAKLAFASAASPLDLIDHINMTPSQMTILNEISHTGLKESVRDYILNTQFRRDLFSRGATRLSAFERLERLKQVRLSLLVHIGDNFDFAITTSAGSVNLKKEVYAPVLEQLASDNYSPKRIGELLNHPRIGTMSVDRLIEIVTVLVGSGTAGLVQSENDVEIAAPRCQKLNRHLIERAHIRGDITQLASPLLGEAVPVTRFQQMFLSARARGLKSADEWAQDTWSHLKGLGQSLIKDGKVLHGDEDNLAELKRQARALADGRLQLLQSLGVVD